MIALKPAYTSRPIVGQLTWVCVWGVVTGIALSLTPNAQGYGTHQQLGFPPCPSIALFGRPCPACGLTTAFAATVQGNLPLAFASNPFGPVFYAAFTASAAVALYASIRRKAVDTESRAFSWGIGLLLTSYLLYGIWRFGWG